MSKLQILSEIANAHDGDAKTAEQLIIASAQAGVDAVKMQKHTADELLVKAHSKYERFKFLEMKEEEWIHLNKVAHENNIKFVCDVFGEESFEFVNDKLSCDGIKIHSSDVSNLPLLKKLTVWSGPIYLSAGGATFEEIAKALEVLAPVKDNIVLMHGFQNFPTSLEETNLRRLETLKNFGLSIGYMDHIDAEDPMAFVLPLIALGAGAVVIEKHITLDRSLKGPDYYSSFEPEEMKKLVQLLRQGEKTLGKSEIEFGEEESEYRRKFKKYIVAAHGIDSGHVIEQDDIAFKRVETDMDLCGIDSILGKRLKAPIKTEELIHPEILD